MDTQAQHSERDRSSEPDAGSGEGSRFSRTRARLASVLSWRRVLAGAVLATVALLLFSSYVVQPFLIPSRSMEPTLQVGDRVLVNKLAYRFGAEPERGDVVVFDGTGSFVREDLDANPLTGLVRGAAASLGLAEPADTDFVKRVVGVGGDRVVCCDKRGDSRSTAPSWTSRICTPVTPPPGCPSTSWCPPAPSGRWATTAAAPATPGTTSDRPAAAWSPSSG